MNQPNLFTQLFQSSITIIFNALGSEFFWVCIVVLTGIGRWLLLQETLLFAAKKDENLMVHEKKKKQRLLFWGRGLIYNGSFFLIIFIILCFWAAKK